jgi:uncharacterized protein
MVNSLNLLLGDLQPKLNEGIYVFACLPLDADLLAFHPVATFREVEGITVILDEPTAIQAGLKSLFRAAWITLEVLSDLGAVGLTAVVSAALAQENIPCNVVAAVHHDHLFVPIDDGPRALAVLNALSTKTWQ